MPRNLDIAALRSFLTVAETGGVTRAASQLNLTQSAVSLQIKRLEDTFGCTLFERSGRGVTLTSQGEQLVGYARRAAFGQRRDLAAHDRKRARRRDPHRLARRPALSARAAGAARLHRRQPEGEGAAAFRTRPWCSRSASPAARST